ncbi:MAG: hypothetical protein KDE27_12005 [Planctomycetes bacterium]|nr:hypothetical protein [Planctomycetota bacterium]
MNPNNALRSALPLLLLLTATPRTQQWSAPTEVGGNELRAVQRFRDGTEHVISRAQAGFATAQLWHSWRPVGGAWRPRVCVSLLGTPNQGTELPIFDGQQFFQLDRDGRAHLVFSKVVAGARQLWHTTFDPRAAVPIWSAPFAVTLPASAATGAAMRFDAQGTLHLLWTAIPGGIGTRQLWHSARPVGGAWTPPVTLSPPGQQGATFCRHPASSFLLEAAGSLFAFYEQVPPAGGVTEVFGCRYDPAAGAWSPPFQISGSGQPATAVAAAIDGNGAVHVFWRATDGLGAPQLFAARSLAGAGFAPPMLLSDQGWPNMGAAVPATRPFVATDRNGGLQVIFDQVPGIGARQVWARGFDRATLSWSPTIAVTQQPDAFTALAIHVDRTNDVHVFAERARELWHASQVGGAGAFSNPVLLSLPGNAWLTASLPWAHDRTPVHEAPDGTLHVLFEQIPGAGVSRIWHTRLDPIGAALWTAPEDVSGDLNSAALIYETHCDERGELHVVFGATEAVGAREQLFHARTDRAGVWQVPEIVSTLGNPQFRAHLPTVAWLVNWLDPQMAGVDYAFLDDDRQGSVDLVYVQRPDFPGQETVFHSGFERFAFAATTTGLGVGDLTARVLNVPPGTTSGYVFLSMAAGGVLGAGPFLGLVPDALTAGSLALPAMPGSPLHWTWPVAGALFPATPFVLPPGFMPAGWSLDFVAVAVDALGVWTPSNVARVHF